MKAEKVVLSFIAVVIGIVVAAGIFYLYQATRTIPTDKTKTVSIPQEVSPTQALPPVLLTVDSPKDEAVVTTRTVTVAGKTDPQATIVISTDTTDVAITPSKVGDFTTTVTVGTDTTPIEITALLPNGQETSVKKIVSYSTENF